MEQKLKNWSVSDMVNIVACLAFLVALIIAIKTQDGTEAGFVILGFLFYVLFLHFLQNHRVSSPSFDKLKELKSELELEIHKIEGIANRENTAYKGKYNNVVILIKTQKEWDSVVQKLLDDGVEWRTGDKTLHSSYFDEYSINTSIGIEKGVISYGNKNNPYTKGLLGESKFPVLSVEEILKN